MSKQGTAPEEGATLVDACRELVRRQRQRGGASAHAEDIAQDACVRALAVRQPETVRDPVHYLMRIVRNVFIDRKRKGQREAQLFHTFEGGAASVREGVDPERILAGKQQLRMVMEAIDALPPRCREAFTLHRFHGLSYAGIARRMGVGTGTVEKHIAEAMLRITRSLRDSAEDRS
jgi:RNA polymerase sigma-70 factor (ECF subfamily)